jgi:hypothetical protein
MMLAFLVCCTSVVMLQMARGPRPNKLQSVGGITTAWQWKKINKMNKSDKYFAHQQVSCELIVAQCATERVRFREAGTGSGGFEQFNLERILGKNPH